MLVVGLARRIQGQVSALPKRIVPGEGLVKGSVMERKPPHTRSDLTEAMMPRSASQSMNLSIPQGAILGARADTNQPGPSPGRNSTSVILVCTYGKGG